FSACLACADKPRVLYSSISGFFSRTFPKRIFPSALFLPAMQRGKSIVSSRKGQKPAAPLPQHELLHERFFRKKTNGQAFCPAVSKRRSALHARVSFPNAPDLLLVRRQAEVL